MDRNRGGAQLGLLVAGAGTFGIFLFLTYFQTQVLHFSPVQTGLGFLPMVAAIAIMAGVASTLLLPRVGPKPQITVGMLLAADGLFFLSRLSLYSTYTGSRPPPPATHCPAPRLTRPPPRTRHSTVTPQHSALIFTIGALACGALLRKGPVTLTENAGPIAL
ncbi:hypothetical protein [Amycolatopsis sp. H20-H5]|uniref:hypothetical protein n=1 Tax=Amycolatopsis sp. H20-H5 TaxID=3046309 RepID=UPI002DB89ADD|nr:hypothetical protein [Amycolatopsis sp. H20-H5]MEC3976215.1 hypothetical protein [Amycolatopsis sp. H20-H5]